jgi:hypothetical protein
MKTQISFKSNRIILVLLAVVIIITTMACSLGGININKTKAMIDITVTQDQVNTLLQNANESVTASDKRLMEKVTSVEMHEGFVRIFGEDLKTDGTSVPGSFDVSVGAVNDELTVKIIAVDMPGVTLDDPRIVDTNTEMANELSKSVRETNGDVLFKEASVSESGLKLKMEIKLSK